MLADENFPTNCTRRLLAEKDDGVESNTKPEPAIFARGKYQPSLDGMRGVAVLVVVAVHARPDYLPGGWIGVDVFFVLSGYLITGLLAAELAQSGRVDVPRFYFSRSLRLVPALWAMLAALLAFSLVSSAADQPTLKDTGVAFAYLMNFALAYGDYPKNGLAHTWSLAVEQQFYLIWPLLLSLLIGRRPTRWIGAAICLCAAWRWYLVASGAPADRVYFGLDTHIEPILIGSWLALVRLPVGFRKLLIGAPFVPLVALCIMLFASRNTSPHALTLGISVAGLATAWLIVVVSERNQTSSALSFGPLVWLGKISYGFYLWHLPVILLGHGILPRWSNAVSILACIALAGLSHRYIEAPFLRLKATLRSSNRPARPWHVESLAAQLPGSLR
ncbi:hypothetical protein SLNSH_20630 [Alsobacter soli]|uniref:Acyltransferase 3 domain-containing protein n=1 Tax=Alsobacter soli TaxID=2109933 RepID=A0A2T1HNC3_9HYPH|nr:acyltransferase [Alsobacter soli]PSC03138.1 hypothetical protein SLNSH_20630 [Alsobacter soli]